MIISEGGVFGHMSHLHDDPNLTFDKIKEILKAASEGGLLGTEKTDGQNLFVSYDVKTGEAKAARNKGEIKAGGLTIDGLKKKFAGRGALESTFSDALAAFEEAVGTFSPEEQNLIFGPDTNIYYNAEVQDPRTANVINYDIRTLTIHRVGHAEYDKETGKPTTILDPETGEDKLKDVSKSAEALDAALKRVQMSKFGSDYRVIVNAVKNLEALSDKKPLKMALGRIEEMMSSVGSKDSDTLLSFVVRGLKSKIESFGNFSNETLALLIKRVLMDYYGGQFETEGAKPNIREIFKTAPEKEEEIRKIIKTGGYLISTVVYPLEDIIHDFAVEALKGLRSAFVLDNESEVGRLKAEVSSAIQAIENSNNEIAMEVLKKQMQKLKDIENVSTAAEGFVFTYDGKTYKFTGNFAPVNQLLGLFKYGRKGVPPLREADEEREDKALRVVGIYPGRFQPMGKHHAKVFEKIMNFDFLDDAFISTSDNVSIPKSPFNFEEKKEIIVKHGIPESNIVMSRNPYKPGLPVNPEKTAVVFFVGAKDMKESPRFANLDGVLKNGKPAYLKSLDLDNLMPMSEHGYVAVAPHESLEISGFGEMSGTTIREALKTGDENTFKEIMGWFDEQIYNLVKSKLSSLEEGSTDFYDLTSLSIEETKKKKYMEPNMLQDPPAESSDDVIEIDEEKLDEISAMAGGAVEAGVMNPTEGGPFSGLNVSKENEDEKKRSKENLKAEDMVVEMIQNYLLKRKGLLQ